MKKSSSLKTILVSSIIAPFFIVALFKIGSWLVRDTSDASYDSVYYMYPTQFISVPIVMVFCSAVYSFCTSVITSLLVREQSKQLFLQSFLVWCGPLVELVVAGTAYILIQDPLDNIIGTFILWIPYLIFTAILGLAMSFVGIKVTAFVRNHIS